MGDALEAQELSNWCRGVRAYSKLEPIKTQRRSDCQEVIQQKAPDPLVYHFNIGNNITFHTTFISFLGQLLTLDIWVAGFHSVLADPRFKSSGLLKAILQIIIPFKNDVTLCLPMVECRI